VCVCVCVCARARARGALVGSNFNINFTLLMCAYVGIIININQYARYEHKNNEL